MAHDPLISNGQFLYHLSIPKGHYGLKIDIRVMTDWIRYVIEASSVYWCAKIEPLNSPHSIILWYICRVAISQHSAVKVCLTACRDLNCALGSRKLSWKLTNNIIRCVLILQHIAHSFIVRHVILKQTISENYWHCMSHLKIYSESTDGLRLIKKTWHIWLKFYSFICFTGFPWLNCAINCYDSQAIQCI